MPAGGLSHRWDLTPRQAVALQRRLARQVKTRDEVGEVHSVAGVDVGFEQAGAVTRAAVAVLHYPSLEGLDSSVARQKTVFPYVPGLLSFRELPAVLEALGGLARPPHLLFCDGQGLAHPRRFGIACHLGLLTGIPSIGVGKSRLVGEYATVPDQRGGWSALQLDGDTVGAVLRTRAGVKPVFVSPGHRVSLESAVDWVMACTTRYRLPETIRAAHRLASGTSVRGRG